MSKINWKVGSILSIETRENVFVLGQMSVSPFIVFFNIFNDENTWENINLQEAPILFCKAVTRQFLKKSNITLVTSVEPFLDIQLPSLWLQTPPGNRKIKVWPDTSKEVELISLAGERRANIVERDIKQKGMAPPKILKSNVSLLNTIEIDKYETLSVSLYPELNERLYICHLLEKKIDPATYIDLEFDIPNECENYVKIIEGKTPLNLLGY